MLPLFVAPPTPTPTTTIAAASGSGDQPRDALARCDHPGHAGPADQLTPTHWCTACATLTCATCASSASCARVITLQDAWKELVPLATAALPAIRAAGAQHATVAAQARVQYAQLASHRVAAVSTLDQQLAARVAALHDEHRARVQEVEAVFQGKAARLHAALVAARGGVGEAWAR